MAVLLVRTGQDVARVEGADGVWRATVTLRGPAVTCLGAAPGGRGPMLAGSRGAGVWRSDDDGLTFQPAGLDGADVYSVAVAADGRIYAGTEPSMLHRSADGGRTWDELEGLRRIPSAPTWSFPPRPWTSHVSAIAPDPHDPDLLLIGIELGGVMRSPDGGRTWEDHRPGAQRDVHALAWHPRRRGRAYEAGGGGAAWTDDGGASWHAADEGRDRHYTWALAVDPEDPDRWYLSASVGPRQAHRGGPAQAAIYRRSGEGPWTLAGGLPDPLDAMPRALACLGETVIAGFADGRLMVSRDRGDRWDAVAVEGDPLARIDSVLPLDAGAA